MLTFRAFGQKTQIVWKFWENFENFWYKFNRNIEFLATLGKVVAKNRAFGNNIIFLQQFFQFRGERSLCPSPLAAPMYMYCLILFVALFDKGCVFYFVKKFFFILFYFSQSNSKYICKTTWYYISLKTNKRSAETRIAESGTTLEISYINVQKHTQNNILNLQKKWIPLNKNGKTVAKFSSKLCYKPEY